MQATRNKPARPKGTFKSVSSILRARSVGAPAIDLVSELETLAQPEIEETPADQGRYMRLLEALQAMGPSCVFTLNTLARLADLNVESIRKSMLVVLAQTASNLEQDALVKKHRAQALIVLRAAG